MVLRPHRRRRSNPWRILFLLLLIAASLYVYTLVQGRQIESPFVPTPTSTRSPFSYAAEGEGRYLEGDLRGAIAAYEQAVRLAPQDVTLYVPLVRLLTLQGWVDDTLARRALEQGQAAVDLDPDYAPAWAVLGMAYDWNGQVERAIEACRRAIELDPAYAEAYAYLAEAYAEVGRWGEAQEAAQTALGLAPRSVDANRAYGLVLETTGNYHGALEAYRKALEIHPNLAYIYMDLGRNYQALADAASAIEAFRRAAQLDPHRADALDQLGWTYFAIQEYEQAQSSLEQAIETDPDYAPAYGHLATTFWVRRNYESAIPNYEKAIELAYQASRRAARGFYVTVEPAQDDDPYPSAEVVMRGELQRADPAGVRLTTSLEPRYPGQSWEKARGRLVLNTATGQYTLNLEKMPPLDPDQVYTGWFEGLHAPNGLPLGTGPFRVSAEGSLEVTLKAEPVRGPRIEHLYTLGLCYFYMARCERAYPLFQAALQIDPQEVNALEGIRLCQEAEATPTARP